MPRKIKAKDIVAKHKKDDDVISQLLKSEQTKGFLSQFSVNNPVSDIGRIFTISMKIPAMLLELIGEFEMFTKGKRTIPISTDITLYNLASLVKQKKIKLDDLLLAVNDLRIKQGLRTITMPELIMALNKK